MNFDDLSIEQLPDLMLMTANEGAGHAERTP